MGDETMPMTLQVIQMAIVAFRTVRKANEGTWSFITFSCSYKVLYYIMVHYDSIKKVTYTFLTGNTTAKNLSIDIKMRVYIET